MYPSQVSPLVYHSLHMVNRGYRGYLRIIFGKEKVFLSYLSEGEFPLKELYLLEPLDLLKMKHTLYRSCWFSFAELSKEEGKFIGAFQINFLFLIRISNQT